MPDGSGSGPMASYSITVRAQYSNKPGMLGRIASTIGEAGGDIGAVDIVRTASKNIVRDISIGARDDDHGRDILNKIRRLKGVSIRKVSDPIFEAHVGGKIEIHNKTAVKNR